LDDRDILFHSSTQHNKPVIANKQQLAEGETQLLVSQRQLYIVYECMRQTYCEETTGAFCSIGTSFIDHKPNTDLL